MLAIFKSKHQGRCLALNFRCISSLKWFLLGNKIMNYTTSELYLAVFWSPLVPSWQPPPRPNLWTFGRPLPCPGQICLSQLLVPSALPKNQCSEWPLVFTAKEKPELKVRQMVSVGHINKSVLKHNRNFWKKQGRPWLGVHPRDL